MPREFIIEESFMLSGIECGCLLEGKYMWTGNLIRMTELHQGSLGVWTYDVSSMKMDTAYPTSWSRVGTTIK